MFFDALTSEAPLQGGVTVLLTPRWPNNPQWLLVSILSRGWVEQFEKIMPELVRIKESRNTKTNSARLKHY